MTDDFEKTKAAFDDAVVARATMRNARDQRAHELLVEARKKIAEQIAEEFPDWQTVQETEATARRTLDDAKIEAGKAKLAAMNYGRGTLVEWDTRKNDWYGSKRGTYYPTGRKGVLQVWDRTSEYPDNKQHGIPDYGEIYIRFLKKDGTPSRQFYRYYPITFAPGQVLPAGWLPEDEKHARAAADE